MSAAWVENAIARTPWPRLARRLLGSRIVGQAALYSVASGAAMALSGVAKAILAGQMGPSAFGTFAFATSFVTLVAVVFDFGLFAAASRRLARADAGGRDELVGASLVTFIPLALMTSAATFGLSFVVDDVFHANGAAALRVSSVLAWAWAFPLVGELLAKGADRLHIFSISNFVGRVALVAGLALMVVTGAAFSATIAVLVATSSMVVSLVIFAVWLRPVFRNVRAHVREFIADTRAWAFQMYVGRFFSIGTYNMDVLMVASFSDTKSTGYYSLAAALAGFMGLPLLGLSAALFPRMARAHSIEKRWVAAAWAVGGAGVLVVVLGVSPLINLVFSKDYSPVIPLAIPLAIAQGVRGVTTVYNTFMSAHARGREMRNVAFILTASNLVLNFALIPPFGATGAAWASLFALVVNYVAYLTYYRRYVRDASEQSKTISPPNSRA
jgi:O-antigen/teichoic acid export membrane protein